MPPSSPSDPASQSPSRRALHRAKRGLLKKYGACDWFRGVAIVPTSQGMGLRLSIDPALMDNTDIPATYYGIDVEILMTSGYRKRNG